MIGRLYHGLVSPSTNPLDGRCSKTSGRSAHMTIHLSHETETETPPTATSHSVDTSHHLDRRNCHTVKVTGVTGTARRARRKLDRNIQSPPTPLTWHRQLRTQRIRWQPQQSRAQAIPRSVDEWVACSEDVPARFVYCTVTVTAVDAIPLVTTTRSLVPVSILVGTSKWVKLRFPGATDIVLWSWVRAKKTCPLARLVIRTSG